MITLIYGGSGSGKSSFAESLVEKINTKEKIYLATMQVYDDEGRQKVLRHQEMRSKKGFSTIESPCDLFKHFDLNADRKKDSTVLLECMSNLVANEMFRNDTIVSEETVVNKVSKEILRLSECYENLIIVSNNIFEDGIDYEETTKAYMRALARINTILAKKCDEIWEVVVGIPLQIKSGAR